MVELYAVEECIYEDCLTGDCGVVTVATFIGLTYEQANALLDAVNPQWFFVACGLDGISLGSPAEGRFFRSVLIGNSYGVVLAALDSEYAEIAKEILGLPMPEEIVTCERMGDIWPS